MNDNQLNAIVRSALIDFYTRRLNKLSELKLKDTLRKKNPYLFRAIGMQSASQIVESILSAYMSSSEETIFGDAFFEPVVRAVCCGTAADGAGVDVIIETDDSYTVISVKSGPNWGNSSHMKKLKQDFETSRRVFDNKKLGKNFRALLGHCYGRKMGEPRDGRPYSVRSGQMFWAEISGDSDFYVKIIDAMGSLPEEHRLSYEEEWEKAVNRFSREFLNDFSSEDGSINWARILEFNSGSC